MGLEGGPRPALTLSALDWLSSSPSNHLLVDAGRRRIAPVVVGRGKRVRLVEWAQPETLLIGDCEAPSGSLLGSGPYAVVLESVPGSEA